MVSIGFKPFLRNFRCCPKTGTECWRKRSRTGATFLSAAVQQWLKLYPVAYPQRANAFWPVNLVRSDRDQVWPGMTVSFTLTLSNRGSTSIQGIVVEDPLPPGLEPREILEGSGAFWDQNSLVSEVAVLPPGGKYTVVFSALVGPDATAEPMLQNRATATTANGLSAQAIAILVLPPLELPPTGDAR